MLKLKNFIFLFLAVLMSAGAMLVYAEQSLPPDSSELLTDKNGRVLGVSEESPDEIVAETEEISEPKKYIETEDVPEIVPVVDKSDFAPLLKEGSVEPSLSGGSIVAMDAGSGKILYGKDENRQRPIASISKLATALTIMDLNLDWDSTYKISADDWIEGGRVYVKIGESIKLKDLLYAGLVASDNTAIRALVSASGLAYKDFIAAMNKKAEDLGLTKTRFVDPVGISSLNVSSALEVAKLSQAAISNGVIRDCLLRQRYVFTSASGVSKTVNSTNLLFDDFQNSSTKLLGGKTGSTGAAGYCFTAMFEGNNRNKVMTVVLGNQSHSGRFDETEKLANWVYGAYEWR